MTKLIYQLKNRKSHWRSFWFGNTQKLGGNINVSARLHAKCIRANGNVEDMGCLGTRVITTAGVNYLRDNFASAGALVANFKYHDSGTGTVAEAITDTALGTPTGDARVAGSQSNSVAKTYTTVATI